MRTPGRARPLARRPRPPPPPPRPKRPPGRPEPRRREAAERVGQGLPPAPAASVRPAALWALPAPRRCSSCRGPGTAAPASPRPPPPDRSPARPLPDRRALASLPGAAAPGLVAGGARCFAAALGTERAGPRLQPEPLRDGTAAPGNTGWLVGAEPAVRGELGRRPGAAGGRPGLGPGGAEPG